MATPANIEQQPIAAAPAEAEPPSGPAAALILGGGISVFCMGLVTTLGEASTGIADGLQWNDRVGPLSGKTLITVIVFAVAWRFSTHCAGARIPHYGRSRLRVPSSSCWDWSARSRRSSKRSSRSRSSSNIDLLLSGRGVRSGVFQRFSHRAGDP